MQLPTDLLANSIKRGSILHSTDFKDIDHGKFFVVIGVTDDYVAGFFFINSRIHPSIMCKPDQLAMQYLLKVPDYPFLRYDSFLSASSIIKKHRNDIATSMCESRTSYIDELKNEDLENILGMLRASKLYNNADKKRFFY